MFRNCVKICRQTLLKSTANSQTSAASRPVSSLLRTVSQDLVSPKVAPHQQQRQKGKQSKKQTTESDSDESHNSESVDELIPNRNSKVVTLNVTSLRMDGVLKSALGIARNKVETLFYQSKIRVNGQKLAKKSTAVHEGDELDLIKGPDAKNPNFMNVARVEILSITANEDTITVKVRRTKSLSVEPYD